MARFNLSVKRPIKNIVIDMAAWRDADERDISKTYKSYMVEILDDDKESYRFSSRNVKSSGMTTILNELEEKYNAVPLDSTYVTVICPREMLDNGDAAYGGRTFCNIGDLRENGIDALDFDVKNDDKIKVRLDTVLDELVHRSTLQYDVNPKSRPVAFENSIHHYERADKEFAKSVRENPNFESACEFTVN